MVILNQGYKGQVMEIYNEDINDKNTLYNELLLSESKEIKLVTIDKKKIIKIKREDSYYNKILEILKNIKEDTLVKKFIYINFLFGDKKNNFNNELDGYKNLIKIFKDKIDVHTTIKEGFKYKNRKIYGIIFNDDYYIFLEKCYKNLEEIKFTQTLLNKCTKEIMETLNILNGNNYIHNDLKPNNIILCKNRFKIIDWESSNYIKNQSQSLIDTKNGNIVYNHPLKFYNVGMPYYMYEYMFDIDMINHKYLLKLKKPLYIKERLDESIDYIIEKNEYLKKRRVIRRKRRSELNERGIEEIEENKNYFMKLYDYWSFGLTIMYLAEMNNLNYNKTLIDSILNKMI